MSNDYSHSTQMKLQKLCKSYTTFIAEFYCRAPHKCNSVAIQETFVWCIILHLYGYTDRLTVAKDCYLLRLLAQDNQKS